MADGATSVDFPERQGFKRVNTPIRDEVRCLTAELQKDRETNHAMQTTPNGASEWLMLGLKHMTNRCEWAGNDPLYVKYHDDEWGIPLHDDHSLFEFLILEGAQAGLSWLTILKKRENYRKAFHGFDPQKIAELFGDGCSAPSCRLRHCTQSPED